MGKVYAENAQNCRFSPSRGKNKYLVREKFIPREGVIKGYTLKETSSVSCRRHRYGVSESHLRGKEISPMGV